MGEVRKRKTSGDVKPSNGTDDVASAKSSGGLGLIPVILIAALVAGSGCYVIRKDNAENFSGIEALTRKLKTENTKTLETVESMRKNLEQKDSVIKELQLKVSAGNEKNRMLEKRVNLVENKVSDTVVDVDTKLVKNNDLLKVQLQNIHAKFDEQVTVNDHVNVKTNDKLEELIKTIEAEAGTAEERQAKIEALEKSLLETKSATAAQTEELKTMVSTEWKAASGELETQAATLTAVNAQIGALGAKVEEGETKVGRLIVDNNAIKTTIADVQGSVTANEAAIEEIKTVGGAQLEELQAAVPVLEAQLADFSESLQQLASDIPSTSSLVILQSTAQKASDGLAAALKDITQNSEDVRKIRNGGEKQLAELAEKIGEIVEDVKKGNSATTSVTESVETANSIISALSNDIDSLKKKFSDLSIKVTAK